MVAAARAANVRIYTVGLDSSGSTRKRSASLAENGGGYSQATSPTSCGDLPRARRRALERARRELPLARPDRPEVRSRSRSPELGTATARYSSPALSVNAPPVERRKAGTRRRVLIMACSSWWACSGSRSYCSSRGPRQKPRDRVTQFVTPTRVRTSPRGSLTGGSRTGAERSLRRKGGGRAFATEWTWPASSTRPVRIVARHSWSALSLAFAASRWPGTSCRASLLLFGPSGQRLWCADWQARTPPLRGPARRPPRGSRRFAAGGPRPHRRAEGRAR